MNKLFFAIALITCNAFGMEKPIDTRLRPPTPISPVKKSTGSFLRRSTDEKVDLETRKKEEERNKRGLNAALRKALQRRSFDQTDSE